jgi:hypothetical protein
MTSGAGKGAGILFWILGLSGLQAGEPALLPVIRPDAKHFFVSYTLEQFEFRLGGQTRHLQPSGATGINGLNDQIVLIESIPSGQADSFQQVFSPKVNYSLDFRRGNRSPKILMDVSPDADGRKVIFSTSLLRCLAMRFEGCDESTEILEIAGDPNLPRQSPWGEVTTAVVNSPQGTVKRVILKKSPSSRLVSVATSFTNLSPYWVEELGSKGPIQSWVEMIEYTIDGMGQLTHTSRVLTVQTPAGEYEHLFKAKITFLTTQPDEVGKKFEERLIPIPNGFPVLTNNPGHSMIYESGKIVDNVNGKVFDDAKRLSFQPAKRDPWIRWSILAGGALVLMYLGYRFYIRSRR